MEDIEKLVEDETLEIVFKEWTWKDLIAEIDELKQKKETIEK